MLKKYSNLIIISVAVLLFGAALYIFQNVDGLQSFAALSRNQVCANKYGSGWYASGNRCAYTEKLYVPANTSGTEYCRNSGPYVPPSSSEPFGYCKKTTYKPYPSSPAPTPTPTPSPTPTPTPTTNTSSITVKPANLPTGQVGKQYPTTILKAEGGSAPYSWDNPAGQIPPGLTLVAGATDSQMIIAGIPTSSGSFAWSIGVRDSRGALKDQKYTIVVNDIDGKPPKDGAGQGGGTGTSTDGVIDVAGFYNPTDYSDIPSFLVRIINIFLSVVGILAVLFIIYGGLRYITSGGNQNSVTAAKNTVVYAILGLVVSVLSFAIVQVLTNLLINK